MSDQDLILQQKITEVHLALSEVDTILMYGGNFGIQGVCQQDMLGLEDRTPGSVTSLLPMNGFSTQRSHMGIDQANGAVVLASMSMMKRAVTGLHELLESIWKYIVNLFSMRLKNDVPTFKLPTEVTADQVVKYWNEYHNTALDRWIEANPEEVAKLGEYCEMVCNEVNALKAFSEELVRHIKSATDAIESLNLEQAKTASIDFNDFLEAQLGQFWNRSELLSVLEAVAGKGSSISKTAPTKLPSTLGTMYTDTFIGTKYSAYTTLHSTVTKLPLETDLMSMYNKSLDNKSVKGNMDKMLNAAKDIQSVTRKLKSAHTEANNLHDVDVPANVSQLHNIIATTNSHIRVAVSIMTQRGRSCQQLCQMLEGIYGHCQSMDSLYEMLYERVK